MTNRYIITEEQLQEWEDNLDLITEGAGKTIDKIRSHPYNPQAELTHFIIPVGLRADVVETLRMAGCPCIAERVLEETMPDYVIQSEREKVLDDLISKFDDMNDERFFDYMLSLRQKDKVEK